jgi:putative oxidoreductase
MKLRDLLVPAIVGGRPAIGLLALRVVFGTALSLHGWPKIQNPLHWMDKAPNPAPSFLQALAAIAEFFGGIAIAIGLLTPLAALGVVATLGYAAYTHISKGDPFVRAGGPSYELAALHLTAALVVGIVGPGTFSIDALIARGRGKRK